MVQNLFNAAEEKCVDTEATDWEVEMTNMVDELDAIISKLTDTSYARRVTCIGRIRRWFTSVIDHLQNEVSISVGYILHCFASLALGHILHYCDVFASNLKSDV